MSAASSSSLQASYTFFADAACPFFVCFAAALWRFSGDRFWFCAWSCFCCLLLRPFSAALLLFFIFSAVFLAFFLAEPASLFGIASPPLLRSWNVNSWPLFFEEAERRRSLVELGHHLVHLGKGRAHFEFRHCEWLSLCSSSARSRPWARSPTALVLDLASAALVRNYQANRADFTMAKLRRLVTRQ